MEKTKTCKTCGIDKAQTDFTKGKAVCKSCRAHQSKHKYKRNKALEQKTEISAQKSYFSERVNTFTNYINDNGEDDLEHIGNQLEELTQIYSKLMEQTSIIYFPVKISSELKACLDQLDEMYDIDPSTALEILMNTPEPIFIENFGISNVELLESFEDELDDLKYILLSIYHANKVLIDTHNKKISDGVSGKEKHSYIEVDVQLDLQVPAITVNNLFHLTQEDMLEKIKEIQDSGNIWVKALAKNGYFRKFWNILDCYE